MASSEGLTLPEDVWTYLAETFLKQEDITSLSSTSRSLRSFMVSLLFRWALFEGTNYQKRLSYELYFAHLLYTQRQIQFAMDNPSIFHSIQYVELWNWTGFNRRIWVDNDQDMIDWELAADYPEYKSNVDKMRDELSRLFQENYRNAVLLINKLPKLRQVTIWEDSPQIWDSPLPLLPQFANTHYRRMRSAGKFSFLEFDLTGQPPSDDRFRMTRNTDWFIPPQPPGYYFDSNKAWTKYLTIILESTSLPIQAAYVDVDLLLSLPPAMIERFHAVRTSFSATARDPDLIHKSQTLVQSILKNAQRLEYYLPSNDFPITPDTIFPHLKRYSGPSNLLRTLFDHGQLHAITLRNDKWEEFVLTAAELSIGKRSQVEALDLGWMTEIEPNHLIKVAELFPKISELTVPWMRVAESLENLWSAVKHFKDLEHIYVERFGSEADYFKQDIEDLQPTFPACQVIEYDDFTIYRNLCGNEWKQDPRHVTGPCSGLQQYTDEEMAEARILVEKLWPGYLTLRLGTASQVGQAVQKSTTRSLRGPMAIMRKYIGRLKGPKLSSKWFKRSKVT
ncbi:hypothetical protein M422DRAFT_25450 [Sphaerobolus stellatus SS14]|nr:hypothetical protein M422DRAFT_25450 [Sphaerobolus stellatus SS14]